MSRFQYALASVFEHVEDTQPATFYGLRVEDTHCREVFELSTISQNREEVLAFIAYAEKYAIRPSHMLDVIEEYFWKSVPGRPRGIENRAQAP